MRFFYDCEFIEDGRTIELVSIGIVAEDGREYYAVNKGVRWERLNDPKFSWLRTNVWPHLPTTGPGQLSLNYHHPDVKDKTVIASEVFKFLGAADGNSIQLWADYCAYDHVAFCQLWGRMIDLPLGIPQRTNDLIQLAESCGARVSNFPRQDPGTAHHALNDARHNFLVFKTIPMLATLKSDPNLVESGMPISNGDSRDSWGPFG